MFETRFGLRRRPFRPVPDTDSYFPAASHEDALNRLRRAVEADEGIMLLTGEPGTGKTLVARKLLESLDETVRTVLLTNSHVTRNGDLLQAILFDLGLPYQGLTEQVARLSVTDSCLEFYREGGRTLIVIDEAQHLHPDVLEELRLLSNLEGKDGKAVQVLLVGLPDVERAIDMPSLAAFRQRLTVRAKLDLLDGSESREFLTHQVRSAGGRPEWIFGDDVLDILTHAANGNPRILNQVAHAAFSLADEAEQGQVDAEAAVEAVTRLGLDPEADAEMLPTDEDPVRVIPARPVTVMDEPAPGVAPAPKRPTIPFEPVILPIEEGPPTYVYGDDLLDEAEVKGPTDRVG